MMVALRDGRYESGSRFSAACALMYVARWTVKRLGCRAAVVSLLAFAALPFWEQRARAEENFTNGIYTVIGGTIAGTASFPFLLADLSYATQGEWLPPGWAITQIVIGGGVNAVVAGEGTSVYSQECGRSANGCGGVLALTIATAVLSAGFIAYGVASLNLYEPEPTTKTSSGTGRKSQGAYLRWVPNIVVTRERSTLVLFGGAF